MARLRSGTAVTADEFGEGLDKIKAKPGRFANLVGFTARAVRYWKSGEKEVPRHVEIILTLMIEYGLTIEDLERKFEP